MNTYIILSVLFALVAMLFFILAVVIRDTLYNYKYKMGFLVSALVLCLIAGILLITH